MHVVEDEDLSMALADVSASSWLACGAAGAAAGGRIAMEFMIGNGTTALIDVVTGCGAQVPLEKLGGHAAGIT
jgi:hypothetical protein